MHAFVNPDANVSIMFNLTKVALFNDFVWDKNDGDAQRKERT